MHESIFSYNISRPYPFKWFTPVVFAVGLVAVTFISFLSVATQGYQIATVYSSNPNSTISNQTFFSGWPSFLTANTKPSCSSTTIPIGTELYTNNTAFKYTVSSIWKMDPETGQQSLVGSFPYQSNLLQECSIVAITINFQGIERNAVQTATQRWGGGLNAYLTCGIETPDGWFDVNLTSRYEANPPDRYDVSSSSFIGRNKTSKASLWWGESMLAWYSIAMTNDMNIANENFTTDTTPAIYKGTVSFGRSAADTPSSEGIKSLDFFNAGCFFVPFSDDNIETRVYYCQQNSVSNLTHANKSDPNAPLPGIWISADSLAKAFYFTLLVDLGQNASGPNILVDPDLLAFFTNNFTAIGAREPTGGDGMRIGNFVGLATDPFGNADSSASTLGIRPSIIWTTYLCQVPRIKSGSTLIISVMINNIVLLSTLWKLFKLAIDYFLGRKYPELKACWGCLESTSYHSSDDICAGKSNSSGSLRPLRLGTSRQNE